jgi:hypothetical protein
MHAYSSDSRLLLWIVALVGIVLLAHLLTA